MTILTLHSSTFLWLIEAQAWAYLEALWMCGPCLDVNVKALAWPYPLLSLLVDWFAHLTYVVFMLPDSSPAAPNQHGWAATGFISLPHHVRDCQWTLGVTQPFPNIWRLCSGCWGACRQSLPCPWLLDHPLRQDDILLLHLVVPSGCTLWSFESV